MTAKNRIIISVLAIFTSLIVAGSMVFIIFAATRGQIDGNVNIGFNRYMQIYGTVTTRYTQVPLDTGFGNGEGDAIIKAQDGKDYIEFKGWEDDDDVSRSLEPLTIDDLSINNPWVIFEVDYNVTTQSVSHAIWPKLADMKACENVEVIFFGLSKERLPKISLEYLNSWSWKTDLGYGNNEGRPFSPRDLVTYSGSFPWLYTNNMPCFFYYMIKVKATSQNASFNGSVVIDINADV